MLFDHVETIKIGLFVNKVGIEKIVYQDPKE